MPCLQVFLSHSITPLGPELVGRVHMESPSGITIDNIHDHPETKQFGVKVEIGLILSGTHNTIGAC